jgi:hypothetical protein
MHLKGICTLESHKWASAKSRGTCTCIREDDTADCLSAEDLICSGGFKPKVLN